MAAVSAARAALGAAASKAQQQAAERAYWAARALEAVSVPAALADLKVALSGAARPEHKVYLWCGAAEAVGAEESEWARGEVAALPGEVFPLLRLCVIHRLRHRWSEGLTDEQKAAVEADLKPLIEQAEQDVRNHFARWAEALEKFADEVEAGRD